MAETETTTELPPANAAAVQACACAASNAPASPSLSLTVEDRLARLENVFNSAPVGLCFVDLEFRYVTVNERFATMYDLPIETFLGRTVCQALPDVADQIMSHLERSLATESRVVVEITVHRRSPTGTSETLVYLRSAQPMRDTKGAILGFSVAVVDITERKAAEAALRESEENYRHTVELSPHIPWTIDAHGNLIELSPRFLTLSGLTAEQADVQGWSDCIHEEDRESVWTPWRRSLATGVPFDCTYRMRCADGVWRWMRSRAFPRRDKRGEIIRWYGTLEDIHERTLIDDALRNKTARLEEVSDQLSMLVREDHLTGLANRRYFDEAFRRESIRARRSSQSLSLIMLDVDFFKRYNDTYGHPAGDACLRNVAQALKACLRRQGDLAARYGGEEFVMLLPDTPEEGALQVASHICDAVRGLAIQHPGSDTGFLTVSAGVACFDAELDIACEKSTAPLLQAADLALYAAKKAGRNCLISARSLSRRDQPSVPQLTG